MKVNGEKCRGFSYVLEDELALQGMTLELPDAGEEERLAEAYRQLHSDKLPPLSALCLSGGGIRSATFNLGVLQGLASLGLLDKFHYLSTVSGGGYIGSWLSAWVAREAQARVEQPEPAAEGCPPEEPPCTGEDIASVTAALAPAFPQGKELQQIRFLRDYSNYLTPQVGLFTWDTWTMLAIYLRNLLINWLMLIPLFFAVLMVPRLINIAGRNAGNADFFLGCGLLFCVLANLSSALDLPTTAVRWDRVRGVSRQLFLPSLLLGAFSLSLYWALAYGSLAPGWKTLGLFLLVGALVFWGGWLVPSLIFLKWGRCRPERRVFAVLTFNLGALVAGGVGGWLAYLLGFKFFPLLASSTWFMEPAYATLAVPSILALFLLSSVVFIVITNWFTGDEDREWWGRAGALGILAILVWLALFACVIYGPLLLLHDPADTKGVLEGIAKAAGFSGVAGLATALLGKSRRTPAAVKGAEQKENPLAKFGLQAAALLFIVLLVVALSSVASLLVQSQWEAGKGTGSSAMECPAPPPSPGAKAQQVGYGLSDKEVRHLATFCASDRETGLLLLSLFTFPLLTSLLIGWLVDPNKFSLHAMYRARLMRAYLGASRDAEGVRHPNPFTGFDPGDNLTMEELACKPLHIVNIAWNVVKGKRLAWQERKAISFTASKLHCGSATVGYRPSKEFGVSKDIGPITLATAMAISGAAASPNMGYHSSPLISFVMAFFNVRLGWWMGNPLYDTWRDAGPAFGFGPALRDLFGRTDEYTDYIYLSDGGHFENLGLYEMVRRRCRYIVVGDASCDPEGNFEDLGNALRKIRVDLGVEILLDVSALKPGEDEGDAGLRKSLSHFAIGVIRYSKVTPGMQDGHILYIKPSLCQLLPGDLYSYAREHCDFPHQPTSDQWFNESQFESYRKLGVHSIQRMIDSSLVRGEERPTLASLEALFDFLHSES